MWLQNSVCKWRRKCYRFVFIVKVKCDSESSPFIYQLVDIRRKQFHSRASIWAIQFSGCIRTSIEKWKKKKIQIEKWIATRMKISHKSQKPWEKSSTHVHTDAHSTIAHTHTLAHPHVQKWKKMNFHLPFFSLTNMLLSFLNLFIGWHDTPFHLIRHHVLFNRIFVELDSEQKQMQKKGKNYYSLLSRDNNCYFAIRVKVALIVCCCLLVFYALNVAP